MAMTTKMLLVAIVFYGLIFAAVVAVIVWAVTVSYTHLTLPTIA